ncbi:UNVERIFIED_CONTAM: hypothetical protein PYX00_001339 [Menopon gallinae]
MPFKKFVETGRVAYITKGRYGRRLCAIVDVVDQNRALIDGPCTGVPRMAIKLKQLRLTKFVIKFPFRASTKVVRKVWSESNIKDKWDNSEWAKNLQKRRLRRQLTDFDRFKLRYAKNIRNKIRSKEYIKMYLADKKQRGKLKFENRGKKGYNRRVRKNPGGKPAPKSVAKPPAKK